MAVGETPHIAEQRAFEPVGGGQDIVRQLAARGVKVADVVTILGSIDIIMGSVDR